MKYFPEDSKTNLITFSFILNTRHGQVLRALNSAIHSPIANLNMTIQSFGLGLFCWLDFFCKLDTNYESSAKWVFQLRKCPLSDWSVDKPVGHLFN